MYCVKAELSTKRPGLTMAVQKRCMMPDTSVRRKNSWWVILACTLDCGLAHSII